MTVEPVLERALRDGAIFAAAVAIVAGLDRMARRRSPRPSRGPARRGSRVRLPRSDRGEHPVASRVTRDDPGSPLFFGIVLGAWGLKLILFLVFAIWLRAQTWLDPAVFFLTVIASVIGSLVLDVVAFQRARVPYVGDVTLPGDGTDETPDDGAGGRG